MRSTGTRAEVTRCPSPRYWPSRYAYAVGSPASMGRPLHRQQVWCRCVLVGVSVGAVGSADRNTVESGTPSSREMAVWLCPDCTRARSAARSATLYTAYSIFGTSDEIAGDVSSIGAGAPDGAPSAPVGSECPRWCPRWDSNPHAFRQWCLRPSRIPVPSQGRRMCMLSAAGPAPDRVGCAVRCADSSPSRSKRG
jgi:hypothetical protein